MERKIKTLYMSVYEDIDKNLNEVQRKMADNVPDEVLTSRLVEDFGLNEDEALKYIAEYDCTRGDCPHLHKV